LRYGPFRLDKMNRVYRLRISSNLSSTSMWVQGVVENADQGPVFDVDGELWDESGYDDGPWHEWVLESHREFRLDEPGDVYVRLFADPEASAAGAPVSFALEEGVMYPTYLLTFGVLGLLMAVGFLLASSPATAARVWREMSD
jgi:hypothetical protein